MASKQFGGIHRVLYEVFKERERQDAKWGGPEHDDDHGVSDWSEWIRDRAYLAYTADIGHAALTPTAMRRQFTEIAALAVAAVESLDRKMSDGETEPDWLADEGRTTNDDLVLPEVLLDRSEGLQAREVPRVRQPQSGRRVEGEQASAFVEDHDRDMADPEYRRAYTEAEDVLRSAPQTPEPTSAVLHSAPQADDYPGRDSECRHPEDALRLTCVSCGQRVYREAVPTASPGPHEHVYRCQDCGEIGRGLEDVDEENIRLANESLRRDRDQAWKDLVAIENAFAEAGYLPCHPIADNVLHMEADLARWKAQADVLADSLGSALDEIARLKAVPSASARQEDDA